MLTIEQLNAKYGRPPKSFTGQGIEASPNNLSLEMARIKNLKSGMPTPSGDESFFSDLTSDIKQTTGALGNRFRTGVSKMGDLVQRQESGETGIGSGFLESMGIMAGGASGAIGDLFTGAIKGVLSPEQEQSVKEFASNSISKVIDNPNISPTIKSGIEKWQQLQTENPQIARNLESIFNIGMLAMDVAGTGLGKKAVGKASKLGMEGLEAGAKGISEVGTSIGKTGVKLADSGIGDLASGVGRSLKNIPEKVGANLSAKKASLKTIEELPTESAKKAASLGIDVSDINTILDVPKTMNKEVKSLVESVKNFASGKSKVRPEEIVGKPMTNALKNLDKVKNKVGSELNDISKNLGVVSREELVNPVFNSLKKVSGLDGLTMSPSGKLNFKNTVLTTKETLSDRKAIQSIFSDAIKWGKGDKKHRLRQELFETLGGKKSSLTNITATQERAYEAIRKGLSDVLDTKNPAYKSLNQEYAKIVTPLRDLRKMMRVSGEVGEDILDMKGGLLARRLTSNAPSQADLKQMLRNIDDVLKESGQTLPSIENLQDVYNVLDRYYDIAAKTGFQGQVKAGVEKGGDMMSRAFDKATGLIQETPDVRRKALEDFFDSILGKASR